VGHYSILFNIIAVDDRAIAPAFLGVVQSLVGHVIHRLRIGGRAASFHKYSDTDGHIRQRKKPGKVMPKPVLLDALEVILFIMVLAGDNNDMIGKNFINQPVLSRNTAGPMPRQIFLQRLRFTCSVKRVPQYF